MNNIFSFKVALFFLLCNFLSEFLSFFIVDAGKNQLRHLHFEKNGCIVFAEIINDIYYKWRL